MIKWFGPALMPPGMRLGQLHPGQNIVDTWNAQEFEKAQGDAGMALGRAQAEKTFGALIMGRDGDGSGGLVGMGVLSMGAGRDAAKHAGKFAETMGQIMPIVSMMGGSVWDDIGGGGFQQGHNLSAMLRPAMQQFGRPNTGLSSGQLRDKAIGIGTGLNKQLFDADGGSLQQTMGINRGEASALYRGASEMQITTSGKTLAGMTMEDATSTAVRETRDITHGAAAIRDLGGQYAHLDAKTTLRTLDQFTMGRLGKGENASDLGMDVRRFKELSQQAGMTPGQGLGLMQLGGARTAELGGDMTSGTISGAHAAAYGGFLQSAEGQGYVKSAGTSSTELMQKDALLTAQAGRSEVGNMAASLMRMGEGGMLEEGTEAHDKFKSLRDDGKFDSTTSGDFRKMLKRSGVDEHASSTIIGQRDHNLDKYGDKVAGAVRELQWETDIGSFMEQFVANSLSTAAGGKMNAKQSRKVGKMVADTLREMGGKSEDEMREALVEKFEGMGMKGPQARSMAVVALGSASMAAKRKGYDGIGEAVSLHSRQALKGIRSEEDTAKVAAQDKAKAAHKGQKGWLGRGIDAVIDGSPKAADFGAKLFGAIKTWMSAADEDGDDTAAAADAAAVDADEIAAADAATEAAAAGVGGTEGAPDDTRPGRRGLGGGVASDGIEKSGPMEVVVISMPPVQLASEADLPHGAPTGAATTA